MIIENGYLSQVFYLFKSGQEVIMQQKCKEYGKQCKVTVKIYQVYASHKSQLLLGQILGQSLSSIVTSSPFEPFLNRERVTRKGYEKEIDL